MVNNEKLLKEDDFRKILDKFIEYEILLIEKDGEYEALLSIYMEDYKAVIADTSYNIEAEIEDINEAFKSLDTLRLSVNKYKKHNKG